MPYCPECGSETTATAKFCKKCGHDLKDESYPHVDIVDEPVSPTGKCAEHPQNNAIGKCTDCGKEICNVCLTATSFKIKASQNVVLAALTALADKLYCPSCIDKLINKTIENTSNLTEETSRAPSNAEPPQAVPGGWNWGAFFLTWIWGIGNQVWISLLTFVPIVGLIMRFVLGAYGNKWAWEQGNWRDIEHFKRTQRKWTYAGITLFSMLLLIPILAGVVVMAVGGVFGTAKPAAYNSVKDDVQNAVTAYATDHQGNFPYSVSVKMANNAECSVTNPCYIINMNALLVSQGGILRQIPSGTRQANCAQVGASGCSDLNHYTWGATSTGIVYSRCDTADGKTCTTQNSGYQDVWP